MNTIFDIIDCKKVIIFEDDITSKNFSKEEYLYDLARMDLEYQTMILNDIKTISPSLSQSLTEFINIVNSNFEYIQSWNDEVIAGQISTAFTLLCNGKENVLHELQHAYDSIDEALISLPMISLFQRYGIGVTIPASFHFIFNDYVHASNRWKKFKVYTSFNADIMRSFLTDINSKNKDDCIVCIVDNNLGGQNKAPDILEKIKTNKKNRKSNIVGSIFSSREKYELIDEDLFFEYTNKSNPEDLYKSIVKSSYSYFISKVRKEIFSNWDKAFDRASCNRNIAFYLSKRAATEGISEYQVINDWIRLMYSFQMSKSESLLELIKLSRVINELDDQDFEFDPELVELNIHEAFDFNINKYFQPPSTGDIFIDSIGNLFVLVGQDCDLMMSADRKRRNILLELLAAKTISQEDSTKIDDNLNYVIINNFRLDGQPISSLRIDYKHRKYISNEVVNLCCFNSNGLCQISLTKDIESQTAKVIQPFLLEYYQELQMYFKAMNNLSNSEDLKIILGDQFLPLLVGPNQYSIKDDLIMFDLRRVCRLNNPYVYYLFKLYLEYRGRQPFDSINLSRLDVHNILVKDYGTSIEVYILQSTQRSKRLHKLTWYIAHPELQRLIDIVQPNLRLSEQKPYYELNEEGIPLNNGHMLKVKKMSTGKVEIIVQKL